MTYQEIEDKGRGGFAIVKIVEDSQGVRFAKKIYSPMENILANVGNDHLKKRFIREIKYQSKIKHLNVVPIVESYFDEEPPYFIMPLAECTLQEQLIVDPTLSGNPKKALFDVLAGLECMHELGYVHRDLKPANILKFIGNGDTHYSISDFGLMSVNESDSSTLTGDNAQGGTQNYAAPELMRNFKSATHLADIYSFGAILHDIFGNGTRRIPYRELSLPGEIGDIVNKCTKSNASRRYNSISSLRDALYKVLDETEVTFSSSNEESSVQVLKSTNNLTDEQWDNIFLLFEQDDDEQLNGCRNIISNISAEHLSHLKSESPELFVALGHYFATHICGNSFDFDYCDILSSKAELLYEEGDLTVKAKIALSLLELGVSHNRWYVQRKFMKLAGSSITEHLANRILVEIEVNEINFEHKILHIENSIDTTRQHLHPILSQQLNKAPK
ncbi:MAG: serine/threonine protein kinase [Cycloclasticus sp.]|jgi:serine/threonine protein kinase